MRVESLKEAIKEAERFLKAAHKVEILDVHGTHQWQKVREPSIETAACKRASMDLTRSLADLRRYD